MRKTLSTLIVTIACSGFLYAADSVTVTGEGRCGKCSLKETAKCQNVIEVTENGKTVKYYMADNKTAKDYHKTVCTKTVKTTATGTVEEQDGKKVMTASKIEEAKDDTK